VPSQRQAWGRSLLHVGSLELAGRYPASTRHTGRLAAAWAWAGLGGFEAWARLELLEEPTSTVEWAKVSAAVRLHFTRTHPGPSAFSSALAASTGARRRRADRRLIPPQPLERRAWIRDAQLGHAELYSRLFSAS